MAFTGPVEQIAVANFGTALPTIPNRGVLLAPGTVTTWDFIGSVQNGAAKIDIGADNVVENELDPAGVEINALGDLARTDYVVRQAGVDTVTFNLYSESEESLKIFSNLSTNSNATIHTAAGVRKAMFIETRNTIRYYPNVIITKGAGQGGYTEDGAWRQPVIARVMGVPTTAPGGCVVYHKQPAD